MHKNNLEILSIWEDSDLFEIKVSGSNGLFSGTTQCYTCRSEIERLGRIMGGFPKSVHQGIKFTTRQDDNHSFFSLNLKCVDGAGHILARVKIAHIETAMNANRVEWIAEFDLPIEPEELNAFAPALTKLAQCPIGQERAVLHGRN